ncbi:MAG: hypothetical protein P8M20_00585 [Planctomycetaceae bacterium]|nr:hypothetical protein [Planctomycetaceae bacterium]
MLRTICVSFGLAAITIAGSKSLPAADPPRLEFTRMVAHWAKYDDPEYLAFIDEAEPELVQLGFYGGHFWSLAHTDAYKGYPAHLPVKGHAACGRWFEEKNAALRKRGVKVVGHFNVEFLVGDIDGENGPTGFFDFYRNHWDEKELGPKPVKNPIDLLEIGPDGKPIGQKGYGIGGMHEYWACLRNPHWQTVMKALVKRGVERGVDGYIANYFYRHNCLCEHCQIGFRKYLIDRHTPAELKQKLKIDDLASHEFEEIVYWHNPEESTPMRREMLRWSQISNKQVFDDVFLKYGRSLKSNLITAQWNHLGKITPIRGDERSLMPAELWGKGEDYLWYSTGGAAYFTDLANRFLGDATLQARYIRGAFDDKPYTLGKYESTRIRAAIAELAANGGAPMGFYTRYTDPEARKVIAQYYQFIKKHDAIYRANSSHAEVALLFPRKAVHAGNVESVEQFRKIGTKLLDEHVLFDVVPDDLVTDELSAEYSQLVSVDKSDTQTIISNSGYSQFELPYTVRVSATRPANGNGLAVHLVNYNREEPPRGRNGKPSGGRGISDEKPIAVPSSKVRIRLPKGQIVSSVKFLTPESPEKTLLDVRLKSQFLQVTLPKFLVYGVLVIE